MHEAAVLMCWSPSAAGEAWFQQNLSRTVAVGDLV